jgi:hypothetical protein
MYSEPKKLNVKFVRLTCVGVWQRSGRSVQRLGQWRSRNCLNAAKASDWTKPGGDESVWRSRPQGGDGAVWIRGGTLAGALARPAATRSRQSETNFQK